MPNRLRIGTVAERIGVSPSTIRNLEREGRIPAAERTVSGYRLFRSSDLPAIESAIMRQHSEHRG